MEVRTESFLQVYLPCSRYSLQLEAMCCKVSDGRQKEHADDGEMDHFEKFSELPMCLLSISEKS